MRPAACLLIVLAMLCLTATTGAAEEGADADDAAEPDTGSSAPETVVTGGRDAEDPFVSDRSLSVVADGRLSEVAPRTTPEALWGAPGVFVQETDYGAGSPIVRGMMGPDVLILVDGVRLNNSTYRTGPVPYLNLIDPHSIARIEVLRGSGGVLYGSDAVGGVVQVFPLEPRGGTASDGFSGGGQAAGRYLSAADGLTGHGHADFAYEGQGMLGGGTFSRFENVIGGREIGEQPYTGHEAWSAIGRLTLHALHWRFDAGYLFSELPDVGRTDGLKEAGSLLFSDNRDHLVYLRVRGAIRSVDPDVDLRVSYQDFFERIDSWRLADDRLTRLSVSRDDTAAVTLGSDLDLSTSLFDERLTLRYGGTWYRDQVTSDRQVKADLTAGDAWDGTPDKPFPDGSTFATYGGYAQVEGVPLLVGPHALRLSAGYRVSGAAAHAPADSGLGSVSYGDVGHVVSGSLRYLYEDAFTAALTYSQGFRPPNLQESAQLGGTGRYFHVPNDDIDPERTDTVEALARFRVRFLTTGTTFYYTRLTEPIIREGSSWLGQTEVNGLPVARDVNGGDGYLWGVEHESRIDVGWGWTIAGNLTYTWGEQTLPGGTVVPLSRIPPLFGQASVRYDTQRTKGWNAFVEAIGRGALKQSRLSPEDDSDPAIQDGGTPDWWTWNVRAGVLLWDRLRLGVTVENLAGETYKYHGSGIYAPGTNAVISAEATF